MVVQLYHYNTETLKEELSLFDIDFERTKDVQKFFESYNKMERKGFNKPFSMDKLRLYFLITPLDMSVGKKFINYCDFNLKGDLITIDNLHSSLKLYFDSPYIQDKNNGLARLVLMLFDDSRIWQGLFNEYNMCRRSTVYPFLNKGRRKYARAV